MAFACEVRNFLGIPNYEVNNLRSRTRYGIDIYSDVVSKTSDSTWWRWGLNFNEQRVLRRLLNNDTAIYRNIRTSFIVVNSNGRIVDYYFGNIIFNYDYQINGVDVSSSLTIQGQFRTVEEIYTALTLTSSDSVTIALNENTGPNWVYSYSLDDFLTAHPFAAPEIVCVDIDDGTQTIVAIDVDSNPPTLTIVDGDPQILFHQVSETEPTPRGSGDSWYNPITKTLSIFTEDS